MQKEQKAEQKECRKQKAAEGPQKAFDGSGMDRGPGPGPGPHGFGDPVSGIRAAACMPCMVSFGMLPSIGLSEKDTSCCRQAVMPSSCRACHDSAINRQ